MVGGCEEKRDIAHEKTVGIQPRFVERESHVAGEGCYVGEGEGEEGEGDACSDLERPLQEASKVGEEEKEDIQHCDGCFCDGKFLAGRRQWQRNCRW